MGAPGLLLVHVKGSNMLLHAGHMAIMEVTLRVALPPHRDLDNMDDLHFGVHEAMMYASNSTPVPGAQWTGIVTQIALEMLASGAVEAVVCVQSDEADRFMPRPVREGIAHQPISQDFQQSGLLHAVCSRPEPPVAGPGRHAFQRLYAWRLAADMHA